MASAALPFLIPSPLVIPQQFLDSVSVAFFSRPQVPDVRQAPDHEIRGLVDFADAAVSQLDHPLREFIQFRSDRRVHTFETNSPRNRVGHYVGQLDARGQVAMDEQRFWQNLAGPLTTSCGELEVPIHLLNQEVALDFLKFIEHDDPVRGGPDIFEVVEETLEKIRIVLTQVVTAWERRRFAHDACKGFATEARANIHQLHDVRYLRLRKSGDLTRTSPVAFFQALPSQNCTLLWREGIKRRSLAKHLALQQLLRLEFSFAAGILNAPK